MRRYTILVSLVAPAGRDEQDIRWHVEDALRRAAEGVEDAPQLAEIEFLGEEEN